MSLYVPFILNTSPQTANRLEAFQRQHAAMDASTVKGLNELLSNVTTNGLATDGSNVLDGPMIYSRAGLYVYLNALVRHDRTMRVIRLTTVAGRTTYGG